MSDLLIRGMEMPKGRPVCIVIDAAGQARRYDLNNDRYADDKLFEAVPVPAHGRLVDADALIKQVKRDCIQSDPFVRIVCDYFKDAPTIIPPDSKNIPDAIKERWAGIYFDALQTIIPVSEEYKR